MNMKHQTNILLPDIMYVIKRNESGVNHHLFELYSKVFNGPKVSILPVRGGHNILYSAILNFLKISPGSLNVVTQGYSVLTMYVASLILRDIRIIVHTWKVPGFSDNRITAHIYDYMLGRLVRKSLIVVVASKKQERQVKELFPFVLTFFAPVTVDADFWNSKKNTLCTLAKNSLNQDGYVLTVGGNDRNEEVSMGVAKLLGLSYVRVTKNQSVIAHVKAVEKKMNMTGTTLILSNISDIDLIALYHNAFAVLLPTITENNPAGLSSLVEALSCGALVAVGRDLAEGYIVDGSNGVVFNDQNVVDIVEKLRCISDELRQSLKDNARKYAVRMLNSDLIAADLQKVLHRIL